MDGFQIGDFVWGKIHGQLWWPGQVCDPSEESEKAGNSVDHDHHVLVAYFGDNSFAWCECSQLKPFNEEFQQMVEQNSSQSFNDALKDAMYEVERCLRSDMTCYCVPPEKVFQFGIDRKNGVSNASIANYSPSAFLNHLQDVAQDVSIANMLDVALLRSWAASFYLRNGCFIKMIEDLFDEKQTDLDAVPDNLHRDKKGGEFQMNGGRVVRRPHISRDEASRKKRSIAELILLADPEVVQQVAGEEDKLGDFEDEDKGQVNPGLLLNQKRKKRDRQKDKVPNVELLNDKHEEENGSARRERKKSKYLSPPYTSGYKERSNSFKLVDSEVSENDSENSQNLQTKFPTYTDGHETSLKEGDLLTHSPNYSEASTHDMLGKLLFAASNTLHLGMNIPLEAVTEFFVKHRGYAYSGILELGSLSSQPGDSGKSGNPPPHEMVSDFNKVASRRKRNNYKDESKQENALAIHQNRENVKKDEATTETPKSDSCLNGVDASKARLRNRGKRVNNEALSGSFEKVDHMVINSLEEAGIEEKKIKTRGLVRDGNVGKSENDHHTSSCQKRKSITDVTNGEHKIDSDHITYVSSVENIIGPKRTKHVDGSNENSAALLLTFSPGSTLPSKDELLLVFGKYGALIKHETELFRDPGCARVVFARATDANKALNGIKKSNNNLPFSVVDCQSFDLPHCPDIPSRSESDLNAELIYISQDLQRMLGSLSLKKKLNSQGLKPEVRKDLVNDIKGLLNKVNKLIT